MLAATDPANPYGAALPWPERGAADAGHRAGRKAGAAVVLVGGRLVLYVERGGRTLLSYSDDERVLAPAAEALAAAARAGVLGRLEMQRADGAAVRDTPRRRGARPGGLSPHAVGHAPPCLRATPSTSSPRACTRPWPASAHAHRSARAAPRHHRSRRPRGDDVAARGKHLLLRIDGGLTLHSHCRWTARGISTGRASAGAGPDWQIRALLETEAWIAVGFRLPVLELFETAREDEVLGHLGPDPLGPDWDPAEALRRLTADPQRSIGEALLDQRVIAGLGNVWRCELCFLRGIHPSTPVGRVSRPDRARRAGEAALRGQPHDRQPGHHRRPAPGRTHCVYGRGGPPCRRCRTPIQVRQPREPERVTYWCPACQPAQSA